MIFKVSGGSLEITSYISEGFPSTRTSQEVFEICLLVVLQLGLDYGFQKLLKVRAL